MRQPVQLQSTLACPQCGQAETLTMAEDSCLIVYDCRRCNARLRPKSGDCCVFCSYGDVPCPPVQRDGSCCVERPMDEPAK